MSAVVYTFRSRCRVTLARLLRPEADAEVKEHTDPTPSLNAQDAVVRLTVPIRSGESVRWFLNDVPMPTQRSECRYLRLSHPHRIVDAGRRNAST